ncbi:hypothetical protein BB560_006266 [Smittium megazygosporum]|uniref:GYF domain-containing protein n=1 Tax=Smittium megazygosporum TaxID=133381 RepID=A0A2T9YBX1_9FUNG|nr:hypothetical protein BB560_006266 [Smittium megazygosporum]
MSSQLNFGPEWMRAAPQPKPSDPPESQKKSSLEEIPVSPKLPIRFSPDELVSLFDLERITLPDELKNRSDIVLSSVPLQPLATIILSEAESQKLFTSQQKLASSQKKYHDLQRNPDNAVSFANSDLSNNNPIHDVSSDVSWISADIKRSNVGSFGIDGSFRMTDEPPEPSNLPFDLQRLVDIEFLRRQSLNSEEALIKLLEVPLWFYRDPKGALQGPFSAINMQEWFEAGYFPIDLNVRRADWKTFETLNTIIHKLLNTSEPFVVATLLEFNIKPQHLQSPPNATNIIDNTDANIPTPNFQQGGHVSSSFTSSIEPNLVFNNSTNAPQQPSPKHIDAQSVTGNRFASSNLESNISNPYLKSFDVSKNSSNEVPISPEQAVVTRKIQLSQLLSEQESILMEINNRHQILQELQQSAQLRLLQLNNDLTRQQSQLPLQQISSNPVIAQEYYNRLQQEYRIAEEAIKAELMQQTQAHIITLDSLESSLDPIVIDAVQRGGILYAIALIRQQLKQLHPVLLVDSQGFPVNVDAGTNPSYPASSLHQGFDVGPNADVLENNRFEHPNETVDSGIDFNITLESENSKSIDSAKTNAISISSDHIDKNRQDKLPSDIQGNLNGESSLLPVSELVSIAEPNADAEASSVKESDDIRKKDCTNLIEKLNKLNLAKSHNKDSADGKANTSISNEIDFSGQADKPGSKNETKAKQSKKDQAEIKNNPDIKAQDHSSSVARHSSNSRQSNSSLKQTVPQKSFKKDNSPAQPASSTQSSKKTADPSASSSSDSKEETKKITSPWLIPNPIAKKKLSEIQKEEAILQAQLRSSGQSSSRQTKSYAALLSSSGTKPVPPQIRKVDKPVYRDETVSFTVSNNKNKASTEKLHNQKPVSNSPSPSFLEWCRSALGSLTGIDLDEFIKVLLTFPVDLPQSDYELISEQVYAHSTSLNGKSFAAEFVRRRKEDLSSKKSISEQTSRDEFFTVQKKGKKNKQ